MNDALHAYNVMASPTPDDTPQQSIILVHTHLFHYVAQANQAQHGSLVDRVANGGLAGSDVRILSKSSRKCTVTGVDQHQMNGLDIVQCVALVNVMHWLIQYYGKGHTIHSSGQIEWHNNLVDDKSVKVGGTQCITTLDGYVLPLKCTRGLMYLSILGKPTDEELVKYPSVHLTSIHEWDPSVLDYSRPEGYMGFMSRGLSIPCLHWLMCSKHLPWLCLHPSPSLKTTNIMSSQKHLIMTNTSFILVG